VRISDESNSSHKTNVAFLYFDSIYMFHPTLEYFGKHKTMKKVLY